MLLFIYLNFTARWRKIWRSRKKRCFSRVSTTFDVRMQWLFFLGWGHKSNPLYFIRHFNQDRTFTLFLIPAEV
ncbi:hypothetical protein M413DRAFT_281247 [Hebeloma cylindrosporum]|uniref:Uncharacterized protein n=1 Tax=Hebeloma cylindrosporum TaxID=76867 RepID=A0A0C3C062_HEBCY|nr:hypothetical protein M413DRAFT_281247 [Hebeloma cylindrosporum h7]